MKYNKNYFEHLLLEKQSENFDKYADANILDMLIEQINEGKIDCIENLASAFVEVDWNCFVQYIAKVEDSEFYDTYEKTFSPIRYVSPGDKLIKFAERIESYDNRIRILTFLRDNADTIFNASCSYFSKECAKLISKYKKMQKEKDGEVLRKKIESDPKYKEYEGQTIDAKFAFGTADFLNEQIQTLIADFETVKLERDQFRKLYQEALMELESLSAPVKTQKDKVAKNKNSLTVEAICKYAKKLEKNQRTIISHMLLKLIKNPDDEIRALIDELDEPNVLDAQTLVLGDNVKEKIVQHE